MSVATLIIAILACAGLARSATVPSGNTIDPRLSIAEATEILATYDTWAAALLTQDPETVADLYLPDAVLLPTISNDMRTTRAEMLDYFKNFLTKRPVATMVEYNIRLNHRTRAGVPDFVTNSGIYSFILTSGGKQTKVSARFTFAYAKVRGKWMIKEQQSSQLPSEFAAGAPIGPAAPFVNTTDPRLSKAEINGVVGAFVEWNRALQTLVPKKVAALYMPDAILVPTVSDDVRTTTLEITDYFVEFLPAKPFGVLDDYSIRLDSVDRLGEPDGVSMSGRYTFTFRALGTSAKGRFTFVFVRVGDRWMIAQHHSSKLPEQS